MIGLKKAAKKRAGDLASVAFCGLYCGDCFWRKGAVSRLASELSAEIRRSGYDRYARYITRFPDGKRFKDFDRFEKVLTVMQKPGCTRACREGGCDPKCGLRRCCQAQGHDGCWQCGPFEKCRRLAELEPIHGDGYLKNLRAIKRSGPAGFSKGRRWWAAKAVGGGSQKCGA
jgi:hypothetical protein